MPTVLLHLVHLLLPFYKLLSVHSRFPFSCFPFYLIDQKHKFQLLILTLTPTPYPSFLTFFQNPFICVKSFTVLYQTSPSTFILLSFINSLAFLLQDLYVVVLLTLIGHIFSLQYFLPFQSLLSIIYSHLCLSTP